MRRLEKILVKLKGKSISDHNAPQRLRFPENEKLVGVRLKEIVSLLTVNG